MSDASSNTEKRFHEQWLGMVKPIEGLVVSIPVLVDAQCMERQPPEVHRTFLEQLEGDAESGVLAIRNLDEFLAIVLGLHAESFDRGEAIPEALSLYVPEGHQTLRPTLTLRKPPGETSGEERGHELLVWDLPPGLDLDRSESVTGTWDYPPSAKFDRLLRHCRVPIGLLTNREVVRLVYAPHGESSGSITFRIQDMARGGKPILDAFIMLLSANRFFGVTPERALPALLAESRKRQANVTNDLADQVFDALQWLLRGFESASERDGRALIDDALAQGGDHLYKGLLTVLLRLVFVLYAEDRGLLPVDQTLYSSHLSVLGLFEELQADHGAYPDSMSRRFGAWPRLVALFRTIYLGAEHGAFRMPPRRGSLFNPHTYPFLEGWGPAGSAPIVDAESRGNVRVPTVDDETVFRVLEKLVMFEGQRLSYRALDVEQIGSVYEALMGYHVVAVAHEAICTRPNRLWMTVEEIAEVPAARRAKWIKETIGLSAKQSETLAADPTIEALTRFSNKTDPSLSRARPGQLVLQPGAERRRTSSHYTPRSLSAPIVRRTLEPLLAVMGDTPASERILNLKVCDPAMGSGAFLVEACRFLADHVVAAWTREGTIQAVSKEHGDPLLHARRVVAQRCLFGVDKNDAAVELAKLSLWLVTLAKDLPFTFLDHALRHGDSLVGLDFDQIRAGHWKPGKQMELFSKELDAALDEAIALRQQISELALGEDNAVEQKEKERLLWDAQDALDRVRLVGDVIVGAFFAKEKDKEREKERVRRIDLVRAWLEAGGPPTDELREMQEEIRRQIPVFHWMLEFPEVFYAERPDPLEDGQVNRAAYMDAFVGNPPFADKNTVSSTFGEVYIRWLQVVHEGAHGNADLSAHFFRRSGALLGAHGTVGLIATNTISQGDTRATGLQWMLSNDFRIFAAVRSLAWPGAANVAVALVHLAKGAPARATVPSLDGETVAAINSRLLNGAERVDSASLAANREYWYQGAKVYGAGFMVEPAEFETLVAQDARHSQLVLPYLGGEELNTSPTQAHERYVINFGQITLEEAARYPSLLSIVETRVKPERDLARETTADGAHRKKYWWQFAQPRPELFAAIRPLSRCLVASRHTKHLAFVFQRVDRVYSEATNVFVSERTSTFATLQSRVHEPWARLLSSSMRNDLRYSASDCFETFPFPKPNPCTVHPALEDAGQRLYDFRAVYMIDENVGLTITYNRLKDPSWDETRIVELRRLHEEMDREVLAAYGWGDVAVPPYCPVDQAERAAVRAFEDEVIDRLFVLNAKRAEDERALAMRQPASRAKLSRTAADSKLPAAKLQDKQPGGPQLGPERTDGSDRRSGG